MNAQMVFAVAVGGAAGSVGRYLAMSAVGGWLGSGFPWGTLFVNVVGSFAMGVLVEASAQMWSPSPELRAMLTVGVLGGVTTFSAFSLDVAVLWERHQVAIAALYAIASVILSVGALFLGLALVRQFLR